MSDLTGLVVLPGSMRGYLKEHERHPLTAPSVEVLRKSQRKSGKLADVTEHC
jgi:hypothetical protein